MGVILTDNGGEFSSEESREMASVLNIWVITTAGQSPFQNGLCECIHAVTDFMLLKLHEEYPSSLLKVLLCWANVVRNALQMWHGFSSYQLVFGKNPNLPNIMTEELPVLEGATSARWLGPGKVVFQDGHVIFVRHGGVFVRVSPNRLIKAELRFDKGDEQTSDDVTDAARPGDNNAVMPNAEVVSENIGVPDTIYVEQAADDTGMRATWRLVRLYWR